MPQPDGGNETIDIAQVIRNSETYHAERLVNLPLPVPSSWRSFADLAQVPPDDAHPRTFYSDGEYIDDDHRFINTCPTGYAGIPVCIDIGIDGYLTHGDAAKLYEMAYRSEGDILQLGTYKGLSTYIMALARKNRKSAGKIVTVDIDASTTETARKNIVGKGLESFVDFHVGDATEFCQGLKRRFDFIFVDHWHGYTATKQILVIIKTLLEPNGFFLMHDYTNPENATPNETYGVYAAVAQYILPDPEMRFFCVSGCSGLFRWVP